MDNVREKEFPKGYAHHEIIQDFQGKPIDYRFLAVNQDFEGLTGLKKEMVVGRRVTEIIPGIQDPRFDWIGTYGEVALGRKNCAFDEYFSPLGKWFSIQASSTKKGYFSTVFQDITWEKIQKKQKADLFAFCCAQFQKPSLFLDAQSLTRYLASFTGAKFSLFITYNPGKRRGKVEGVDGKAHRLEIIHHLLSFPLLGMEWPLLKEKYLALKNQGLIQYQNLYDFGSGFISRKAAGYLDEKLSIERLYAIAIPFGQQVLGEFCLALTPGRRLNHPLLVREFARQIGFFLQQKELERKLVEGRAPAGELLDPVPAALCLIDSKGYITALNRAFCQETGFQEEELLKLEITHLGQNSSVHASQTFLEMVEEGSLFKFSPPSGGQEFCLAFKALPNQTFLGWGMLL